jgi:uncharacterized integral membrane protein
MQKESISRAAKSFAAPTALCFAIKALGSPTEVSMTFQGTTASVPAGVVAMIASVTIPFIAIYVQNAFMAIGMRNREMNKRYIRGFSLPAFEQFNGDDEIGLAIPIVPYGFFAEKIPVGSILTMLLFVVLILAFLPLFFLGGFLTAFQFEILQTENAGWVNYTGAVCGLFAIISAMLYMVFFNLPLPMKRNCSHIRWNLLCPISDTVPHPQIDTWSKSK